VGEERGKPEIPRYGPGCIADVGQRFLRKAAKA
jgi:hypothetical protein